MKKLLSISFALILIVSMFSACSNGEEKATGKNKKYSLWGLQQIINRMNT